MKTIPDQHLFTVRGRPVMFCKDEKFFGALHAVERGNFPVSQTGFYSLSRFALCAHEQRIGFLDLLSENFLASIAAEQDRQTGEVLRDITQCTRCDISDRHNFVRCSCRASLAFEHGLFATDTQRRQLWQAAHETYSNMFDSAYVRHAANKRQNPLQLIETDRQTFDNLRRCMNGDFSPDNNNNTLTVLRITGYCDLPPRPGGEPVIPIPSTRSAPPSPCATGTAF